MKKNGFTLSELLAVIVIVGLLITIATLSVSSLINSSRNQTNEMILKNLEDAAITYAMEKVFIPNDCAIDSIISDSNSVNLTDTCKKEVTVSFLIQNSYFKDDAGKLKDGKVTIYKYKVNKKTTSECSSSNDISCYNVETRAFASSSLIK